jgi:hypothetical protein
MGDVEPVGLSILGRRRSGDDGWTIVLSTRDDGPSGGPDEVRLIAHNWTAATDADGKPVAGPWLFEELRSLDWFRHFDSDRWAAPGEVPPEPRTPARPAGRFAVRGESPALGEWPLHVSAGDATITVQAVAVGDPDQGILAWLERIVDGLPARVRINQPGGSFDLLAYPRPGGRCRFLVIETVDGDRVGMDVEVSTLALLDGFHRCVEALAGDAHYLVGWREADDVPMRSDKVVRYLGAAQLDRK